MNKSNLWILLFPLLFSCSMENDPNNSGASSHESAPEGKHHSGARKALLNYDGAGIAQNQLMAHFMAHDTVPDTLSAALREVALASENVAAFQALLDGPLRLPSETRLAYLTDGVPGRLDAVLLEAPLSPKAKLSMSHFCNSLAYYKTQQAAVATVTEFITSFEASVFADPDFDSGDLNVMLTAASLSRHALQFASTQKKRRPRDRDWDISVGHITVAIDLGDQSAAAIALACATVLLYENF